MATGYQGYQGYGDPERAKVDRARQMAELLQQGATDTSPKSFWEGAAQLGKAFIARGAMDKADKAESAYGDNQKKALDLFLSQNPFGASEASPAPQDAKLGSRALGQSSARASSRMSNPGEAPIPNVAQMAETLAMTSASPDAAMQSPAPAMTPPPAMAQPRDVSSKIASLSNVLMGPRPERPQQVAPAPQMDIGALVRQRYAMTGDMQGAIDYGQALQRQQLEDQRFADQTRYARGRDTMEDRRWNKTFGYQQTRDQIGDDRWNTEFDYRQGRDETDDQYRERVLNETVRSNRVGESLTAQELAARREEAERKANAASTGGAVFEGPQLATIYNKSMDALADAEAAQSDLSTVAATAQQFLDVVGDDNWIQGDNIISDLMQAGSFKTTELKALTDRIAPLMRKPGSGSSSDTDVKMFKNSVVNVNNTPEANKRFAQGAVAMSKRNQEYIDFLNQAITPSDPQSRQKANQLWGLYKNEVPLFDSKTGEVLAAKPFTQWLSENMAQQAAPAVDDGESLIQKWSNR